MARDGWSREAQGAWAELIEAARSRGAEVLRELSRAGEDTSGRAHGAFDEVLEETRKGTEQLIGAICKEVGAQLGHFGIATKDDLADLERRMASRPAAERSPAAKKASPAAKKASPGKKASPAKKAAPAKRGAKKTAG